MVVLNAGRTQELFNTKTKNKEAIRSVFIAQSSVMRSIYSKMKNLAHTKTNILILGDKGTGRKSTASEIFYQNNYSHGEREFLQLDCKSMSPHLIEQKLFGDHNSPSYTPLLKSNQNNTIYLKGISDLSLTLQQKIYSYLTTEKNYNRPRLICSSDESITKKIQNKKFSQELFNVLSEDLIILPLLKERQEDIFHLMNLFNKNNHFNGVLSPEALDFLQSYNWSGNITELKMICLKLSILYPEKDIITKHDLSHIIKDLSIESVDIKYDPNLTLDTIVNLYIEKALQHFRCKKEAAEALDISIKTIYNKMKSGVISEKSDSSLLEKYFKEAEWSKA